MSATDQIEIIYRGCPPAPDSDRVWTTRFVFAILRIQVPTLVCLAGSSFVLGSRQLTPVFILWVLLALGCRGLLRAGRSDWAARAWVLGCWIFSLVAAITLGGVEGATFYTFLIMHMVAILLMGYQATPGIIALAAVSTVLVVGLGSMGILPTVQPVQPMMQAIIGVVDVLIAGSVLWLMVGRLESMVEAAEHDTQILAAHNLELESTRAGLAEAVAERTRDFQEAIASLQEEIAEHRQTEEQLHEALGSARAATKAKSAFLANMSHEIRTPLNGVLGLVQVLLSGNVSPAEQPSLIRAIESSGQSLQRILDDILDLSKLEAGRLQVEAVEFDLHRLMEDVVDTFALDAHKKDLDLVVDWRTAPRKIVCDMTRLRQILVNLVGNAVKFTKAGRVEITVSQDGPRMLIFVVRDTGVGIAHAVQRRLFEAFSQGDASTTREFGGTGLGLAICRRLVALLGGVISVESDLGKGARFSFTIKADILESNGEGPWPGLSEKSALVIEPRSGSRGALAEILRSFGMPVEIRASGSEPVPGNYDVLVVGDLAWRQDPDAVRRLQALAKHSFYAASLADLEANRTSREAGFAAVLGRPFFAARVHSVLSAATGSREEPGHEPARTGVLADEAPLSILLAEDNAVNRLVARRVLALLGYSVVEVEDGEQAVEAVCQKAGQNEAFDVVLMDMMMPRLDGVEATRRIRAVLPDALQPRILALTANVLPDQQELCLEAGMDEVLTKPIHVDTTRQALFECFQLRSQRKEA